MVVCYITVLSIAGRAPELKAMALNAFMLSWFAKMDGAGHLWFVTGLMSFYLVLVFRFRICRVGILGTVLLVLALQSVGWILHVKQVYLLALIFGGLVTYRFGDRILEALRSPGNRLRFLLMLIGGFTMFSGGVCMFDCVATPIPYYWFCLGLAAVISLIVIMLMDKPRVVAPVAWLVGLSYEIYLVHYPFCASSVLGLRHYISNRLLYVLTFFVVTVFAAKVLQMISKWPMGYFARSGSQV